MAKKILFKHISKPFEFWKKIKNSKITKTGTLTNTKNRSEENVSIFLYSIVSLSNFEEA